MCSQSYLQLDGLVQILKLTVDFPNGILHTRPTVSEVQGDLATPTDNPFAETNLEKRSSI